MERRRSTLGAAVALSLAAHGLLLAVVMSVEPPPAPRIAPSPDGLVSFELWSSPVTAPAGSLHAPPPQAGDRQRAERQRSTDVLRLPSAAGDAAAQDPVSSPDAGLAAAGDAPLRVVRPVLTTSGLPPAPRNGAGKKEVTDAPGALARDVGRRMRGWVEEDVGNARGGTGLVDPYFEGMRVALETGAADGPAFTVGSAFASPVLQKVPREVKALVSSWLSSGEAYAKTGNPYVSGAVPEGGAAARPTTPLSDRWAETKLGEGSRRAAMLRDFASGKFGQGIVAQVEIRQARDGRLLGFVLVRSSGNAAFDRHVLEVGPATVAKLPPPPGEGFGLRAETLRSLWSFEGRVSYVRKPKPGEQLADLARAQVVNGMISGLTGGVVPKPGTFVDETTGELAVIDFSRPKFACAVKLLRVY